MGCTPVISIIIPVYRAEKFLSRCLDSVLSQSFTNWECILVDDGSPDKSGVICDEYTAKDERFRVIHKENGGASTARNRGIEVAKGEWITFVDADDYISFDMLENLSRCIQEDTDFILGGHRKLDMAGNVFKERCYKRRHFVEEQFTELLSMGLLVYQKGPVAKLFKTSILFDNNIRFVEGAITGEDEIFLYTYFLCSKALTISDDKGYNYIDVPKSLTTQGTFPFGNEIVSTSAFTEVSAEVFFRYPEYEWIMRQWTFYVDKLINSIYKYSNNKEIRLQRIRQIDVAKFAKWKKLSSPAEFVLVTLLRLRLFRIYDFIRTIKK